VNSVSIRHLHKRDNKLVAAIGVSVAIHVIVLLIHFVGIDPSHFKSPDDALEVILVNSRSLSKPSKATAIAQSDLNGGGDHDKGRAKSFLPRSAEPTDGDILKQADEAVARVEALQKRLLSQLNTTPTSVLADPNPKHDPQTKNVDIGDPNAVAQQIARLEAQVDREIDDYNARPRRGFIGPNTKSATYAVYYNQWRDKVERIGNLNYPEEARGRYYGDLILTVTLSPDGTIYKNEIEVTRPSGYPTLDRAARRIVRMAAPFGRFPDDMRREYDVFEIVIKFTFTKGDGFEARIEKR
jgi:periplasmic protein TonB